MNTHRTLAILGLSIFIGIQGLFDEAKAATIKKATIINDNPEGAANDVTLRFGNTVGMVTIMVPGGQPIMCNPVVIKPGDPNVNPPIPPVLSNRTYKCDGFDLTNRPPNAQRQAMVTYKSDCDICKLSGGQWSIDGVDVGAITITNPGLTVKKGSVDLTFFNEQPFSVTYQDIQVFEGNNIANFNLDDYATPTGSLVSGIPSSIVLNPNESYTLTINNIVEDPSTYVLGTATFFPTNDPTDIGQVATATDFTPSVCVPENASTLSLLALGTFGAGATLKRKLKPSKSTQKETTKVC